MPIVEVHIECLRPSDSKERHNTFIVNETKARRFFEIFNAALSELERVENCPDPEAEEYERDGSWPKTAAV